VETAAEKLRSKLRGPPTRAAPGPPGTSLRAIVDAEIARTPYLDPREAMRVYDLLVAGLTPADVKRAFESDWSGSGSAAGADRARRAGPRGS
jgi:hypothetical protein